MDRKYKSIQQTNFQNGTYSLVPIRDEDKYRIRQWRNEQIDILRQKQALSIEEQEHYFATVISSLFEQEQPRQLLFSFLENNTLIGYGGLVYIDWESKNAEVSFLTETGRNASKQKVIEDWCNYLQILKPLVKGHLGFTKIYTYAYDIRPHLYNALLQNGFIEEARLKDHIVINDTNRDVLIHSCFLNSLVFRMAVPDDMMQYFEWANDEEVRKNSYQSDAITLENHKTWFSKKLDAENYFFYYFLLDGEPAGQVRINTGTNNETIIGISVDKKHRGQSISSSMLKLATNDYLAKHKQSTIVAYIKEGNALSLSAFKKAAFGKEEVVMEQNHRSHKLYKTYTVS